MYTEDIPPVKERLLTAAVACLRRKGFAATTARDIAGEANANLRSIGYHYGSTRGLLLAAISSNWRTWLAPLISAAEDSARDPAQRLQHGMELFAGALAENAPIVSAWLEAVVVAHHDEELREVLAHNQSAFREALARTLAEAGHEDAERRAAAIVTVCDGIVVAHLLHGSTPSPREVAAAAAAALA